MSSAACCLLRSALWVMLVEEGGLSEAADLLEGQEEAAVGGRGIADARGAQIDGRYNMGLP